MFARRTKEVWDLIPELYMHGLSQGDFDLALRGLLGEGVPLSESSVARLKAKWQAEYEQWNARSLGDLEVVYLLVDGIYVKAGLEKDKACILVALAGLSDGTKVFLGLEGGHRESIESWSNMFWDLRQRGLRIPRVVIGDGNLVGYLGSNKECVAWSRGAGITGYLTYLISYPRSIRLKARCCSSRYPMHRSSRGQSD